jgi:hypothetical protein
MEAICPIVPRVFIGPKAKRALDSYISICPDEISGLGEVIRRGSDLLITSIVLFPQEVTIGSTDLDQEQLQSFLFELVKTGQDPSRFKLWWHSHVYGECFWSSTDEATCGRFNNDWMVSVVGNKYGKYRCRLDLFNPCRVTIDQLPLEVFDPVPADFRKAIEAEIATKVRRKKSIKQYMSDFVGDQKGFDGGTILGVDIK